jgi:hypothetical protein
MKHARLIVVPWWVALPFVLNVLLTFAIHYYDRNDTKNAQITELATHVNNTEQALMRCVEAQSDLAKSIDRNTDQIASE